MEGGFHEHAHFMFGVNEMFWKCFVCFCLRTIGVTKVYEVTNDLEHNAYSHHQTSLHVITLAVVAYLMQDVQDPPPQLLLRGGLPAYAQHVQVNAGGKVLLEFLKGAGAPTVMWQRAARRGDGVLLKKLFAYSYHVFRSTCHKPNKVQHLLIALLGFCSTLPAVQVVLQVTVSLSLLGRKGSNMYCDRLLEMVNNIQQGVQGSSSGASFRRACDLTTLLQSILHVRHAFQDHETGAAASDDPITPSMLVQARTLQQELRRLLGNDLTVPSPNNPFWHTGNPTPLDAGTFHERRPWEWVWRTAEGRSAGKGRAGAERWDAYANRMLYDHYFPF